MGIYSRQIQESFSLNQCCRILEMPIAEMKERFRNKEFSGFWDSLSNTFMVTRESLLDFMEANNIPDENLDY